MARNALKGNYLVLISAQLLVFMGNFLLDLLLARVFQGEGRATLVMYEVCSFSASLIMNVFSAGVCLMFLRLARGEEYSYTDMLHFLRNDPDRVIVAGFFITGVTTLAALPARYYLWKMPEDGLVDMNWIGGFWAAMVFMEIMQLVLTLVFALVYWLLCDNGEMEGLEAVKTSCCLMKGNRRRLLRLYLSFLPAMVLSLFTFGVGFLWLAPLVRETEAFFYRDITGDLAEG